MTEKMETSDMFLTKEEQQQEDNLNFDDVALTVLKERYLHTDISTGVQETPNQMLQRVAKLVGNGNPVLTRQFYIIMANLDFLPNSPTLINAGREGKNGQLSACYVLDVPDSMEGIFEALKKQALIHKSGGGTGFNFSKVRAKGSAVSTTGGIASGPVSFMELFDTATEKVMQGGARRGANMGILNCDHPDVLEFIKAKCNDDGTLSNFNISVGITDKFMEDIIAYRYKKFTTTISREKEEASRLWDAIIFNAWSQGDPGVVFLDTINRNNPTPELGPIDATNPCGETPLYPNEACNLGSINLSNFVLVEEEEHDQPSQEDTDHTQHLYFNNRVIDWKRLSDVVAIAVEFLNNVIDVNHYPLPEISEAVKKTRKIGLGVMGWADMLFKLGISYKTQEARDLATTVMSVIQNTAKKASRNRNVCVTCIAPTGSISLLAGCSSGIEPLFSLSYDRVCFAKDGDFAGVSKRKVITITNPEYEKAVEGVYKDDNRIRDGVFVTAHDVTPSEHVLMQAAFQKHTDLAVSKTVNLPNSASFSDIDDVYRLAWYTGCKGVTVYRDGCKSSQVLYDKDSETTTQPC